MPIPMYSYRNKRFYKKNVFEKIKANPLQKKPINSNCVGECVSLKKNKKFIVMYVI